MLKFQNKLEQLRAKHLEKLKNKKGFTLIELIIVIVIIAILVMVAMPDFLSTLGNSKVSATQSSIKVIGDSVTKYYSEVGKLPDAEDMDSLKKVLTNEETLRGQTYGPWLKDNVSTKDSWNNEYRYEVESSRKFDIISAGADGEFDTDDDISYNYLGQAKEK